MNIIGGPEEDREGKPRISHDHFDLSSCTIEVMADRTFRLVSFLVLLSCSFSLAEVETVNGGSDRVEEEAPGFLADTYGAVWFLFFIITGHVWMWGLWWLCWKVATFISSTVDEPLRKAMSNST